MLSWTVTGWVSYFALFLSGKKKLGEKNCKIMFKLRIPKFLFVKSCEVKVLMKSNEEYYSVESRAEKFVKI